MKRIATILMCCLAVICANADTYETHSNLTKIIEQPKVRMKFEFYGKVGLNIMSADWTTRNFYGNSPSAPKGKLNVGFDLSLGMMSHFRPTNPSNFYWGAELSFTQLGGGIEDYASDDYYYPSHKLSMLCTSLSPTIGWKKEIVNDISLDLHFGAGVLYKFKDGKLPYEYISTSGGAYKYIDTYLYVPLKIGVGIWYKRFNVDLSYKKSLKLVSVSSDVNYSNILISVGYRF